jgi:hypothetical protein
VAGGLPTHRGRKARISAWSHQTLERKIGQGELKDLRGVAPQAEAEYEIASLIG